MNEVELQSIKKAMEEQFVLLFLHSKGADGVDLAETSRAMLDIAKFLISECQ